MVQRIAKLSDEIIELDFDYHLTQLEATANTSDSDDDYFQMAKDNYLYLAAGAILLAVV